MDLGRPISSVIPSAHGPVVQVLAGAEAWLSPTQVTELLDGAVSRRRVVDVLAQLAEHGIAESETRGGGGVFRLNRNHLAAEAIQALATMRQRLIELIRVEVESWPDRPVAAFLFGSAARGDGDAGSDVDILLVRPDDADQDAWEGRVERLADRVAAATGNVCQILDPSVGRFQDMVKDDERLVGELHRDGLRISGQTLRELTPPGRGRRVARR